MLALTLHVVTSMLHISSGRHAFLRALLPK
jgi:hypothetical protein